MNKKINIVSVPVVISETLCSLSEFKKDGIIKVFGKTIEIVDINKLEVISKRG